MLALFHFQGGQVALFWVGLGFGILGVVAIVLALVIAAVTDTDLVPLGFFGVLCIGAMFFLLMAAWWTNNTRLEVRQARHEVITKYASEIDHITSLNIKALTISYVTKTDRRCHADLLETRDGLLIASESVNCHDRPPPTATGADQPPRTSVPR